MKKMSTPSEDLKPQTTTGMKKTLGLFGLTINAMAFIAPGAFLWLTIQAQAAQVDPAGASTAPDIWFGLFLALILSFLTAASYAWLAQTLSRCWRWQFILLCSESINRPRKQQPSRTQREVRGRLAFTLVLLGLPRCNGSVHGNLD